MANNESMEIEERSMELEEIIESARLYGPFISVEKYFQHEPNRIVFRGVPPLLREAVFNMCEVYHYPVGNKIAVFGVCMESLFEAEFTETLRYNTAVESSGRHMFGAWLVHKKYAKELRKFLRPFVETSGEESEVESESEMMEAELARMIKRVKLETPVSTRIPSPRGAPSVPVETILAPLTPPHPRHPLRGGQGKKRVRSAPLFTSTPIGSPTRSRAQARPQPPPPAPKKKKAAKASVREGGGGARLRLATAHALALAKGLAEVLALGQPLVVAAPPCKRKRRS